MPSHAKLTFAVLIATAACATARPAGPPPPPAPPSGEEGFQSLFDESSTDGWKQAGPGEMVVDGPLARSKGGMGLWYYEKKSFKNFALRLEFRQEKITSNSGVFVRFPRVDGDPWIPVKEGYEIQIDGDKPGTHATGSVYSFKAADSVPIRPAGEWNQYEITAVGQDYTIRLNGEVINTYRGDRATEGMIGLQNHSDNDVVEFRNVRIKELP